ncbi:hypothetical protein [Candidatus Vidania fulgoroideorum]
MKKKKLLKVNIRRNKKNIKQRKKIKRLYKEYFKTKNKVLFNKIIGIIDKVEKHKGKEAREMKKLYRKVEVEDRKV